MQEIKNLDDIKQMVDTFYDKVNKDKELSYIFNDFAKINWVTHLPIMYSFWSKLLLGEGDYRGNPFQKHIPLPIESHHFDRWVELFKQNIDEQFIGEIAEEAKLRAENIAYVFDNKLSMLKLEY
jgi:globin